MLHFHMFLTRQCSGANHLAMSKCLGARASGLLVYHKSEGACIFVLPCFAATRLLCSGICDGDVRDLAGHEGKSGAY